MATRAAGEPACNPSASLQVAHGLAQFLALMGTDQAADGVDEPVPMQDLLVLHRVPQPSLGGGAPPHAMHAGGRHAGPVCRQGAEGELPGIAGLVVPELAPNLRKALPRPPCMCSCGGGAVAGAGCCSGGQPRASGGRPPAGPVPRLQPLGSGSGCLHGCAPPTPPVAGSPARAGAAVCLALCHLAVLSVQCLSICGESKT